MIGKFVTLCLFVVPCLAIAQNGDNLADSDQKRETSSVIRTLPGNETNSGSMEAAIAKYESREKKLEIPYDDLIDPQLPLKSEYLASIDFIGFLRSSEDDNAGNNSAKIIFGIRRPYYRVGKITRCAGVIDLKISGSVGGCENIIKLAFGYDFSQNLQKPAFDYGFSFLNIGCQISIPFDFRLHGETRKHN